MPRSDILGIWMSQMRRDVLAAGADCRNSAAEAIGLAHVSDFNGATQHGVGPYPLNVVDGVRINTGITASSWLALGPIGTGALGLLLLGQDSLPVFTAADMPVIGQVAQGLGIVGGAILWGYGIWWLSLAIIVTVRYLREGLPFNIGWWGFTFPLGVYSVGTLNLAKQTHVDAIADFGIVLVAMLAVFWLIVATRTWLGAWRGDLFVAPCLMTGIAPVESDFV